MRGDTPATRRELLRWGALAAVGGIAGCSGDGQGDTTATETTADEPTTTVTRSEEAGVSTETTESQHSPTETDQTATPAQVIGSWPMFQRDPGNTGSFTGTRVSQSAPEAWNFTLDRDFQRFIGPVVKDGMVYTVGATVDNQFLLGITAETGDEQWRISLGEEETADRGHVLIRRYPRLAVFDGRIYVPGNRLEAYEIEMQEQAFSYDVQFTKPTLFDGRIYGIGRYRYIVARDAVTGDRQWATDLDTVDDLAVATDNVFVAGVRPRITALRRSDGTDQWVFDPDTEMAERVVGIGVRDGIVYLTSDISRVDPARHGGHVFAVDTDSGEEIWRFTSSYPRLREDGTSNPIGWTGPAIAGDTVFFAGASETEDSGVKAHLYAMNRATGEEQWRSEITGLVISGYPIVVGDIVCTAVDDVIHGIDATTGDVLWRHETLELNYHSLASDGARLFVPGSNKLTALTLSG